MDDAADVGDAKPLAPKELAARVLAIANAVEENHVQSPKSGAVILGGFRSIYKEANIPAPGDWIRSLRMPERRTNSLPYSSPI